MDSKKEEKKFLRFTYILCFLCFTNLFILKKPFDTGALIIATIMCMLIAYAHFIIRRFFPDGDKYILIFSFILSVIGIAMIYRLNTALAVKQIIWFTAGVGAFILIVVLLPDLKSFSNFKYFYMIMTIICMAAGTFAGKEINGSKNWIFIGSYSFQPTEFGKLFLVAYLASSLKDYDNYKKLIQPAIIVMISLGFMVLQKDLGSALIFFGISVTMLYIATSKFKYVIFCMGLFVIGGLVSYKLFGHVRLRFMIWKNPWPYAYNESHQLVQSFFSIASGGMFGSGLGLGHPQFVTFCETDFIFSAICEEFGALMGFGIIILYFLLFYRCMRAAVVVGDKFSRLLAVGYSTMIASQAIVIIGGVTGMIPLTGITLPLISYGGSSMLITYFALGIIQKISEEGNIYE